MNNGSFDFNAFVKESKDFLLNPKSYFSVMPLTGGLVEPLIKAVIYGVLSGAIAFLWSILKIGATGGLFGGAVGIMAFIGSVIGAVIGLFIGGVIILILSSIAKGNTDFEANVRVCAAVMVLMPIGAALSVFGHFSSFLGSVVNLAVNLFSVWLIYNGLVEALKAKPDTSRTISFVLAGIFVLFMLVGMGSRKAADKYMDQFKDLNNQIENTEKN